MLWVRSFIFSSEYSQIINCQISVSSPLMILLPVSSHQHLHSSFTYTDISSPVPGRPDTMGYVLYIYIHYVCHWNIPQFCLWYKSGDWPRKELNVLAQKCRLMHFFVCCCHFWHSLRFGSEQACVWLTLWLRWSKVILSRLKGLSLSLFISRLWQNPIWHTSIPSNQILHSHKCTKTVLFKVNLNLEN